MQIPDFDVIFVKEWESKLSSCGVGGIGTYEALVQKVRTECLQTGSISKETLRSVLKWKDPQERVERKVDWSRYETIYEPRFRLIVSELVKEHHMMEILLWGDDDLIDRLPVDPKVLQGVHGKAKGFGVPVASTFLHFVYPDRFPIIDVRTVEVLFLFDMLKSTAVDVSSYRQFRGILLGKGRETGCSLRTIDKALFAFHEQVLQPAIVKESERLYKVALVLNAPKYLRESIIREIKGESGNKALSKVELEYHP